MLQRAASILFVQLSCRSAWIGMSWVCLLQFSDALRDQCVLMQCAEGSGEHMLASWPRRASSSTYLRLWPHAGGLSDFVYSCSCL